MKTRVKTLSKHLKDVAEIRENLIKLRSKETLDLKVFEKAKNYTSNATFNLNYPHLGKEIGVEKLNSLIFIDKEKMIVKVEPSVPMDHLATMTLEQGVMIPVIPEFKGITVGGAINGAAIESSSHLYGQFNDNCLAYEVLLGNGDLVRASPEENSDLFYGIAGSYGSLGIIVSVEIRLIPAKPWVCLTYHHFHTLREALGCIDQLHEKTDPPEFLEGIVFSGDNITVVEGRLISLEQASLIKKKLTLNAPWSPWYFQHVEKNRANSTFQEKISLFEYLFRHDRGAFWMGAYALHWSLLFRYFFETQLGLKKFCQKYFGKTKFERYFQLREPTVGFRIFLGSWMSSRRLYKMLHASAEKWFSETFVIQDYFIPKKNTADFIDLTMKEMRIFPLWLCPVKATADPQIFSPHYLNGNAIDSELLIDVGIYGMPYKTDSLSRINTRLDQWTSRFKGRKMLYSYCYYTAEEFWKIYPKETYERLREQYHASEMWIPIFEKISQQKKPAN